MKPSQMKCYLPSLINYHHRIKLCNCQSKSSTRQNDSNQQSNRLKPETINSVNTPYTVSENVLNKACARQVACTLFIDTYLSGSFSHFVLHNDHIRRWLCNMKGLWKAAVDVVLDNKLAAGFTFQCPLQSITQTKKWNVVKKYKMTLHNPDSNHF